jgi:rRNA-processing protein FCF1
MPKTILKVMKVILDTNFLIDCMRFKVDLKELGNELFVLDSVIFEIGKIAKRGTKESSLAKLALEFIAKNNFKILETGKNDADESLLAYSKDYAIATHDKALKNKLKKAGAKIIYIRQKKYLVVE